MIRETAAIALALAYGEYIIARWGFDGLRRLLVAQGDTLAALGVPFDQFERGWRDFVTARYL